MNRPSPPIISPEEWQALQAEWPSAQPQAVDVWFPLRVWYLLIITALFATALLLSAPRLSVFLSQEPAWVERLTRFLYFRGWFVVGATALGLWAYTAGWQLRRVFGLLSVIGTVNLVSDLFIVYPERLSQPTLGLAFQLVLRLLAIAALYACYRNAARVPERRDRFNLWLPFRPTTPSSGRFHA